MALSSKPKDLKVVSDETKGAESWFYEEKRGFYIVVRVPIGEAVKHVHLRISWKTILSSVSRYLKDKKK